MATQQAVRIPMTRGNLIVEGSLLVFRPYRLEIASKRREIQRQEIQSVELCQLPRRRWRFTMLLAGSMYYLMIGAWEKLTKSGIIKISTISGDYSFQATHAAERIELLKSALAEKV